MNYTLYGNATSRAFRVIWMLEELGVPYSHVPVRPHTDDVRKLSPLGKIPVLEVDGQAIPDSMAIMAFLADRHARLTYPAGSIERARQDAWTYRILDELEGPLWIASRHAWILPEDRRVEQVGPSAAQDYERHLTRIVADMEGPYLMGAEPTVPDLLLTHCASWARSLKFTDGPEAFGDYVKRMRARPAFKAAAAAK